MGILEWEYWNGNTGMGILEWEYWNGNTGMGIFTHSIFEWEY